MDEFIKDNQPNNGPNYSGGSGIKIEGYFELKISVSI